MGTVKYAIFQGKIGLYAQRYIDNQKELKREYPYITSNKLPVIVNRMGGYSTYRPEDKALKIIEIGEDESPLTREERYPKNSPAFEYGWISPEGDTYNTGAEGHTQSATAICEENGWDYYAGERRLEGFGWVKVTMSNERGVNRKLVFCDKGVVTDEQAATLERLGLLHTEHVPFYLRHSHNNQEEEHNV